MMKMKKMQVSILRGWSPQGVASRRAAPKKALVPVDCFRSTRHVVASHVVKVSSGVRCQRFFLPPLRKNAFSHNDHLHLP